MKQKFRKLTFVHVQKEMPPSMQHFESDFDAIVEGTYSQLYGGTNVDSYSLYQLEKGKIVNKISWYYENQLTALEKQNNLKAETLIEAYNFKRHDNDGEESE